MMDYRDVLRFWFTELTPQQWWTKSVHLDRMIRDRFAVLHQQAASGECDAWRSCPEGALAEVIVLDQFSRNMYRDDPRSFAFDGMALTLAQHAVEKGYHHHLSVRQLPFLFLPYMHSESLKVHEQALVLFSVAGLEDNYEFELKHKAIIERFGRYPHRNALLGRRSSDAESLFLTQPGSSF
ncbi:MAG: DUF924 domain-containing protein [Pseudomonadales bacterium]|nr:DUF924 domain-containing protein [Pseudomonadales bacterium]